MGQRHHLCRLDEISDGGSKGFEFGAGTERFALFVIRRGTTLRAYENSCPHTRGPLDWVEDQFLSRDRNHILCATHGALFDIETGACLSGPCVGESLRTLRVWLEDGAVVVEIDDSTVDSGESQTSREWSRTRAEEASMANEFSGFPRALPDFLGALAKNNTKAWLDANRADYETLFIAPAKAFVAALGPRLQAWSPDIHAEPRVNGSIMRINRDIRFSKDKTPYKTTLDLIFPENEGEKMDRHAPSLYFRITADALHLGAGMHGFSPEQLAAYRAAVCDDTRGKTLCAVTEALTADGHTIGGAHYKRVPRGFDANHPNASFLLHNGLTVGGSEPAPAALFDARAVDHVLDRFEAFRPIQAWLVDALR